MGATSIATTKAQKNIFPNISVKDWNEWINHVQQTCEKQYFKHVSYSADYCKDVYLFPYIKVSIFIVFHDNSVLVVGVSGLEPESEEPKSSVLTITPYPKRI